MPHHAARLNEVNNKLVDTTGDTEIIAQAETLEELATDLGLSQGVRDFVAGLTPAVQDAALGAIKQAGQRGWSVHTTWKPGVVIQASVFEDPDPGSAGGTVNITFSTPRG